MDSLNAPSHCDRCGKRLTDQGLFPGAECPFCGVIFAKLDRKRQEPPRRRPAPIQPTRTAIERFEQRWLQWHPYIAGHHETLLQWSQERMLWPRLITLAFMSYLSFRYLFNASYHSIFDGMNLGVHEAGHVLFGIFPTFIVFLGGTLLQLMLPLICAIMLLRQPDYFGVAFCGTWLGSSFFHVAVYQADAQTQSLPLVTIGGGVPIHDWAYMLGELDILKWDGAIAFATRCLAFLVTWSAVAYGAWTCRAIWLQNQEKTAAWRAIS